jgi:hypothetical protein
MEMIWITGDIHGDPQKRLSLRCFPEGKTLTKNDYVIIAGDFGCIWDYRGESKQEKYNLDWLENLPFSVLFVDGNHENFSRLNEYPVKSWKGGRVHVIRPHVLHLMRGYVFNIEGKRFFTFGGAASHDIQDGVLDPVKDKKLIKEWQNDYTKMFRVLNVSWWAEEMPNHKEMERGLKNLEKAGNKVDFIVTHSPSTSNLMVLGRGMFKADVLSDYLEQIKQKAKYTRWISGHMHVNAQIFAEDIIIYEQIIRLA